MDNCASWISHERTFSYVSWETFQIVLLYKNILKNSPIFWKLFFDKFTKSYYVPLNINFTWFFLNVHVSPCKWCKAKLSGVVILVAEMGTIAHEPLVTM